MSKLEQVGRAAIRGMIAQNVVQISQHLDQTVPNVGARHHLRIR